MKKTLGIHPNVFLNHNINLFIFKNITFLQKIKKNEEKKRKIDYYGEKC